MIFRRLYKGDGFTLIEVMAAMAIFTAVTLGITPLLLGSLRSATVGRTFTVAKNVVSRAMERARGLPYFESVKGIVGVPPRRDLLDLYFPNTGPGFAGNAFTTVCSSTSKTPAPSAALACPTDNGDGTSSIPAGYTLTIRAEFVQPLAGSNPTTFSVVTVPGGYNWQALTTETPPSDLLRLTIVGRWSYGKINKSFTLQSLVGNRKLSEDELAANATINHLVQMRTGYVDALGNEGSFRGEVGRIASTIQESAFAAADQEIRAGHLFLTEDPAGSGDDGEIIAEYVGASSSIHAPPSSMPVGQTSEDSGSMTHPVIPGVIFGGIGTTHANFPMAPNRGVEVLDELPTARGNFRLVGVNSLFMDNQKALPGVLKLDPFERIAALEAGALGRTTAEATPVTPVVSRKVEATAYVQFSDLNLYPTTFAPQGVVRISNFQADIRCTSKGNGFPEFSGAWSATLTYWHDPTPGGSGEGYRSFSIDQDNAESVLADLKTQNPFVRWRGVSNERILLFSEAFSGDPGYLTNWSTSGFASDVVGERVKMTLGAALTIEGAPTDPARPFTSIVVSIGSMTCDAVDERG